MRKTGIPIRLLAFSAVLAGFQAGCAPPAVVVVNPNHDAAKIRRVALVGVSDYPGISGSGGVVASVLDKYLLQAYNLVERRRVTEILKEQTTQAAGTIDPATMHKLGQILGVDALVFGDLTDYMEARDRTVMMDMPQEHSDPIWGRVTKEKVVDGVKTTVEEDVITGYNRYTTAMYVEKVDTQPAHVGMSVRLVDIETGEVIWSASSDSEGADAGDAAEKASSKLVTAVMEKYKKK